MLRISILLSLISLIASHGGHGGHHNGDEAQHAHAEAVPPPHPSAHLSRVRPPRTLDDKLLRAARDVFPLAEVKALLDAGASLRARDPENGFSPLHWTANNAQDASNINTWYLLLARGADVHAVDAEGATPLHRAAMNNCLAMAELLVERGARIDARDRHGFTPLMYAARFARVETGLALIKLGADVHAAAGAHAVPGAGSLPPIQIARDFEKDHPRMGQLIAALKERMATTIQVLDL